MPSPSNRSSHRAAALANTERRAFLLHERAGARQFGDFRSRSGASRVGQIALEERNVDDAIRSCRGIRLQSGAPNEQSGRKLLKELFPFPPALPLVGVTVGLQVV